MVCSSFRCALRHDRTHRVLLAICMIRRGEADMRRGDEEALQAAHQREAQLSSSLQVLRLAALCVLTALRLLAGPPPTFQPAQQHQPDPETALRHLPLPEPSLGVALPQELRSQLEAAAGGFEETEARLRREAAAAESRARDAEAALAEASASASDSSAPLLR